LKRNLVHVRAAGEDLPRLAQTSTPKEWAEAGKTLFERKQYTQARSCFERAGLPREMAIAHAYVLRQHASRLPIGKPGNSAEAARQDAFVQAADAFLSCSSKQSLVYFRRSGECFEAAGRCLEAADAYYQGESYTESVLLYRRLGKFDEAVEIVFKTNDKVRQDVADDTKNAAKLYYLSRAETELVDIKFTVKNNTDIV
jgi:tetratricopeptide (TPR) repeat protein